MIDSELSQEFNTRKQLLLKALYSYVSQNMKLNEMNMQVYLGLIHFKEFGKKLVPMY